MSASFEAESSAPKPLSRQLILTGLVTLAAVVLWTLTITAISGAMAMSDAMINRLEIVAAVATAMALQLGLDHRRREVATARHAEAMAAQAELQSMAEREFDELLVVIENQRPIDGGRTLPRQSRRRSRGRRAGEAATGLDPEVLDLTRRINQKIAGRNQPGDGDPGVPAARPKH